MPDQKNDETIIFRAQEPPTPVYVAVYEERDCCAKAFHCDEGAWYKCRGKGELCKI